MKRGEGGYGGAIKGCEDAGFRWIDKATKPDATGIDFATKEFEFK